MLLVTWNVNSIRVRLPRVLAWLERRRPDVVCLQELKCIDGVFPREAFEALGYHVETYGQKTYNGVAILSLLPLTDVVRGMPGDPEEGERRVLAARVGGDVTVMNVYVVNGQEVGAEKYRYKLEWMKRLRDHVAGFDLERPFALLGDFNVTFDDRDVYDPKAWHEKILCSTPERESLASICSLGLLDSFRKFTEEGGHYTWWDFRTRGFERGQGLRIDHVLLNEAALARCRGVAIEVDERRGEKPSDHAPVVAEIAALS
jgi:exodeoxyribonuclease-3